MESPCFVQDIYPQHLLYGRIVRSPIPCGRLVSFECPKLPTGCTLLTASDIPGENLLLDTNIPILAQDKLLYFGEPVALLFGPDEAKLDELFEQCKVICQEEPAGFSGGAKETILAERHICTADVEAAFKSAKTTVHGTYRTDIQEHWESETLGAVIEFVSGTNADKRDFPQKTLVVHTATQWPCHVKRSISRMLKLDDDFIRVMPSPLGIHLDGKFLFPSLIACQAALGAWVSNRPVRLVLSREEDFFFSPKRNASEIDIQSALNENGQILGTKIDVTIDMGAYGPNSNEILDQTCLAALGIYNTGGIQLSGRALQTNVPPQGPFSGFGMAQGSFAIENHVSRIAAAFKQNPAQWRKNNCMQSNSLPAGLPIGEKPPAALLLDKAAAMGDYQRKWAAFELIRQSRRQKGGAASGGTGGSAGGTHGVGNESLRGIGIAFGYLGSGFLYAGADKGSYRVELTLEKDGSLEIKTNACSPDNGLFEIWACLARDILSIDLKKVFINTMPDAPDSGPASASRNITVVTKLVERACIDIRGMRFRDPLPITVGRSIRPKKNNQWDKILNSPPAKIVDGSCFANPGWAAAVVELEIDLVAFAPKIRGVWLCVDGGKIYNEQKARNSLILSSVQALGWAYHENIKYINGRLPQEQFDNFSILSPQEIPSIQVEFANTDSSEAKGIGGLPFTCIPAAFMQAISQSIDRPCEAIPLLPVDIWKTGFTGKEEKQP